MQLQNCFSMTEFTVQELKVIVMPLRLASHYGPLRIIVLTMMK